MLIGLLWIFAWLGLIKGFDLDGAFEDSTNLWWAFLVPSLVYLLYHPVIEVLMRGNTPGKRKAGIAVVDTDGNEPSTGAVLLRNIMRLIDSFPTFYVVGLVSIIITKEHVRLGDMVAGTRTIVADDSGTEALEQLNKIKQASIPPEQAELVYDLLKRWRTLNRKKRQGYAEAILKKAGVEPVDAGGQRRDQRLREQLEALLA